MKINRLLHPLVFFVFILASIYAEAQTTTKQLSFPSGRNSTSASSTIKGYASHDYKINLGEGESLSITLKSNKTSNYFNVLPPGSTEEADYNSSINGNTYNGKVSASGVYTIRVYLDRNLARQNVAATYTLLVGKSGSGNSGDALVPGTNYNATGKVKAYLGTASGDTKMADFGVIRSAVKNKAIVHLTYPGGMTHVVNFNNGQWTCGSQGCRTVKFERLSSGEWKVTVDDYTTYFIFDEVITGG